MSLDAHCDRCDVRGPLNFPRSELWSSTELALPDGWATLIVSFATPAKSTEVLHLCEPCSMAVGNFALEPPGQAM